MRSWENEEESSPSKSVDIEMKGLTTTTCTENEDEYYFEDITEIGIILSVFITTVLQSFIF